jgi:oligoribonuclease NrnB/cAMP/cGMP phosphodiesterase (DHH superfamily)
MTRIKVLTHSDLDGVGCYVATAHAAGPKNVSVEYCEYHNINEKVTAFLDSGDRSYDYVLITDISVNEEVANRIDLENESYGKNVWLLIDHHKTAEWLDAYDWATVYSEYEDPNNPTETRKSSGTSMVAHHFVEQILHIEIEPRLAEFIEKVRRYDSWEWSDIYNDVEAKQLNDLLSIYGRKDFLTGIQRKLMLDFDLIEDTDAIVLKIRQDEIDRYIRMKEKSMQIITYQGYRIGFLFNERFSSEMGNTICKNHPDIDFVAMINMDTNSVSLRTAHDDVDVSAFAKKFGGGGHAKASGMPLNEATRRVFMALNFPGVLAQ